MRRCLVLDRYLCSQFWYDPTIEQEWLWVSIGMVIAACVLELGHTSCFSSFFSVSKRDKNRTGSTRRTEVFLTVCPLGIQRWTRRSTTETKHEQFIPLRNIKDCILVEHLGAFDVSTHVMLRLFAKTAVASKSASDCDNDGAFEVVEAFPGVRLLFAQCHSLQIQIATALKEVQ